jgi:hypothetical protein
MIFPLAEVLRLKKFRQANDLGSALSGIGDAVEGLVEILFWLRAAGHLDQGHAEFFWRQRSDLRDQYSIRGASNERWAMSSESPFRPQLVAHHSLLCLRNDLIFE